MNFSHKIANVLMIYFFFMLVLFSVEGLLFCLFHLSKLVKYFIEDSKTVSIKAIVIESLERSVYPFSLAVHMPSSWMNSQTIVAD